MDPVTNDPRLHAQVVSHKYPLLFTTISGAHLYGFASPDSDFDLRGVHVLPARQVLGLGPFEETIERSGIVDGAEIDLVTHDAGKFFAMMLKKNGYVLEQLLSPLVVHTTAWHDELREIGKRCVTRFHAYHYLGFAQTQWNLYEKESPRRVKPLLYVYRVLLTGIHLMRTGEVQANLPRLNEIFALSQVPELVARKRAGPEKGTVGDADHAFHTAEYFRLRTMLEEEMNRSPLPEGTEAKPALNDLLVRIRLAEHNPSA